MSSLLQGRNRISFLYSVDEPGVWVESQNRCCYRQFRINRYSVLSRKGSDYRSKGKIVPNPRVSDLGGSKNVHAIDFSVHCENNFGNRNLRNDDHSKERFKMISDHTVRKNNFDMLFWRWRTVINDGSGCLSALLTERRNGPWLDGYRSYCLSALTGYPGWCRNRSGYRWSWYNSRSHSGTSVPMTVAA